MIHIAQLIFVKDGRESIFLEYEDKVIPLMEIYNGHIMYRIRPNDESFITAEEEKPYEIHILSFGSEQDLANYLEDDKRKQFLHLKNDSIKASITIKGELL